MPPIASPTLPNPACAGERAGLPEAAHVHQHDLRVAGGQLLVRQPPLVELAGPEVLEHDVALLRQPRRDLAGRLLAQVEHDRSLVAADARPPEAVAVAGHAPSPHRVAVAGRLDLDDVGAVVAEQLARERTGDEVAQLEDADAVERSATRRRHVR